MKYQVLAAALVAGCAAISNADVLWDQSQLGWAVPTGFPNVLAGNPNTYYTVADVNVTGAGWTVNSVSMYFSCFDFNWPETTTGRLNIFTQSGALPSNSDNPASGGLVPGLVNMTVEILNDPSNFDQAYYRVTASGLNINLAAGSYWIGLTPVAPSGFFGPESGLPAANQIGAGSPFRSPFTGPGSPPANTWVNLNAPASYDAAILVQGVALPTPGAAAIVGLGGLIAGRRRRA
ncbi:MAG: hypothetical protein ACREJO_12555 [Phycisphaerales bacterium]